MAKYFSIKKAIELAKSGKTKKEVLDYFGITEKQYKKYYSQFSEANRKKLTSLLIGNGRHKASIFSAEKAIKLAEEGKTKQELIEYFGITESDYKMRFSLMPEVKRKKLTSLLIGNGRKNSKDKTKEDSPVEEVWDTSYIISQFCNFANREGRKIVILKEVHEQLERFENKGNKRVCKFFHLVAEKKFKIAMIQESHVPDNVPLDQDIADFEIIEYAKNRKNTVVYTCDKGLATRCSGLNIAYEYFNNSKTTQNIYRSSCKEGKTKTINIFSNPAFRNILLRRGKHWGINPEKEKDGVFVFSNNVVKRANKHFVITLLKNDILVIGQKSFRALDNDGNVEVV